MNVEGYREGNIAMVNRNKEIEETILRMLDSMRLDPQIDQRWLQIGRTTMEQAFMAINRAVFKPGRIDLERTELPEADGMPKTTVIDTTTTMMPPTDLPPLTEQQ
jgi:hypothetical protein